MAKYASSLAHPIASTAAQPQLRYQISLFLELSPVVSRLAHVLTNNDVRLRREVGGSVAPPPCRLVHRGYRSTSWSRSSAPSRASDIWNDLFLLSRNVASHKDSLSSFGVPSPGESNKRLARRAVTRSSRQTRGLAGQHSATRLTALNGLNGAGPAQGRSMSGAS